MTAGSLLSPADALRSRILRGFAPRSLLVHREKRVAALGTATVLAAFAGSCLAPVWMLALSPLVLGVPHLLADLRYLVVRPGLHRRPRLWIAAGLPLGALAVGDGTWVWPGLAAAGGALLVARGTLGRRLVGLAALAILCAWTRSLGPTAGVVFAHLHNVLALALWWAWRPRRGRWHWIPLGLAAAGAWILFALPFSGDASTSLGGLSLGALAASLSGGLSPDLGLRLAVGFAFGQALHYAVWLRLLPEEDRARPVPRSFSSSFRALKADFGAWPLALAGSAALGIALWAVADLAAARAGYFRLSLFHGHLELAAAALFWVEGRPLRSG